MAIPDRAHRSQRWPVTSLAKRSRFAQQAVVDHLAAAAIDALGECLASRIQREVQRAIRSVAKGVLRAQPRSRRTEALGDFQRSNDAPRVVRVDAIGGFGIDLLEAPVQPEWVARFDRGADRGLEFGAPPGIGVPSFEKTFEEC